MRGYKTSHWNDLIYIQVTDPHKEGRVHVMRAVWGLLWFM